MRPEEQLEIIKRNTVEIISEDELLKKLKRAQAENRPLRVKLGLDPTAPDIHLGHTVVLRKMREFQDLGHEVIIIIGDFTGAIGDPTGRSETRKQLTKEEILANAKTYQEQFFKILDPDKTKIMFNSQWLGELKLDKVIDLASRYTVARMLEREDFSERLKQGIPISIHEFFYPLMQGYDSVVLKADVELGATEQKFNVLMGRTLQKEYGQEPQIAIMMPILVGIDGVRKMSKSLGNYIGIDEDPNEIYGKAMSIPDEVMMEYFNLVTNLSKDEINQIERDLKNEAVHPRDVKMKLARLLVELFHGEEAAENAQNNFIQVFQNKNLPEDIPIYKIDTADLKQGMIWLPHLLKLTGLVSSTSEAQRLIAQGAVRIDNEKVTEPIELEVKSSTIIQVGKRKFINIVKE